MAGVDLELHEGEILCVVGESGSGKSTLALACLRLLAEGTEVHGSIRLDGRDLLTLGRRELRSLRGRELGFVYQDALAAFSPLWTVGNQIAETVRAHQDVSRKEALAADGRAARAGAGARPRADRPLLPARAERRAAPAGTRWRWRWCCGRGC